MTAGLQQRKKQTGSPIFRRILVLMSVLIAIEIIFLTSSIFGSRVNERLNQNAKDILEERVINRKNYLENEMLNNWSNLELAVQTINADTARLIQEGHISMENLDEGSTACEPLITEVSDVLISLLRNNRVTGAFLVLNTHDLDASGTPMSKPGVYLRDLDPMSAPSSRNMDLLLERGPASVVQKQGISTDTAWKPTYDFDQMGFYYPFFYEPFQKAFEMGEGESDISDFGYWSRGYMLLGDKKEVISYSVPLILPDGTVYGVLGVDLTMDYLKKMLPYGEIFEEKLGAYILAIQDGKEDSYKNVLVNGSVYEYFADSLSKTETINEGGKANTWITCEDAEFYCNIQPLYIYNSNTSFSDQQWVLMGAVRKTDLFAFSNQILISLLPSVLLTFLSGILGSFFIGRVVSKPIGILGKSISVMEPGKTMKLGRTGITEIDRLASAIELLNQEVIDSSTKFQKIIEMASVRIGGFEYNRQEDSFFITEGFSKLFGLSGNPADITAFQREMDKMRACIISEQDGELLFKLQENTSIVYIKMKYIDNGIQCIGLAEDVTQTVQDEDRIKHERDHDLQTGLLNRRAFYATLQKVFEQKPEVLKVAALVMMDLDNLKNLNDSYGHDSGDKYICCAAEAFRRFVPDSATVSRISGDEFYIFFYGYESKEEIRNLVQKLHEGIRTQSILLPNMEPYFVKASGGIAWYPDDSMSYEELLKFSDFAMYKTKQSGKGEMNEFNIREYNKEAYLLQNKAELTEMLEKSLVQYHFQPILDASTGVVFAYEALMRVNMPTLHTPDEVLTLARLESKLAQVEILTWFKAMEAYDKQVLAEKIAPACKIFINSVPNQILPANMLLKLEERYASYLHNVVLEITENEQLDENMLQKKKIIISNWDAAIALDDYGSGYNTEKNLLSLTPNYIKIDMEIVRDIDKDINKRQIVSNIVSYAHERNMKLIAEGIETEAEAKAVIAIGVDYLQGYLFGKPELEPSRISDTVLRFLHSL